MSMTTVRAEDRPATAAFAQVVTEIASTGIGFRFQAKGRSMLPTIQDGEILHVRPVDPTSIKTGEIVLFCDGDGFKAHRVIRKERRSFITCGDTSAHADGKIRIDQVVGRVVAKECAASGEIIRLDGIAAWLQFLKLDLRRRVSKIR